MHGRQEPRHRACKGLESRHAVPAVAPEASCDLAADERKAGSAGIPGDLQGWKQGELRSRESRAGDAGGDFGEGVCSVLLVPSPLQQSIKLTRQLQREVRTRTEGETSRSSQARREKPKGSGGFRWTAEQKDILRRDYARRPTKEVAARLGMSVRQIRVQARRLGVKRDPDIMIAEAKQKATALNAQALG